MSGRRERLDGIRVDIEIISVRAILTWCGVSSQASGTKFRRPEQSTICRAAGDIRSLSAHVRTFQLQIFLGS
jgi:hypothetical protein